MSCVEPSERKDMVTLQLIHIHYDTAVGDGVPLPSSSLPNSNTRSTTDFRTCLGMCQFVVCVCVCVDVSMVLRIKSCGGLVERIHGIVNGLVAAIVSTRSSRSAVIIPVLACHDRLCQPLSAKRARSEQKSKSLKKVSFIFVPSLQNRTEKGERAFQEHLCDCTLNPKAVLKHHYKVW